MNSPPTGDEEVNVEFTPDGSAEMNYFEDMPAKTSNSP